MAGPGVEPRSSFDRRLPAVRYSGFMIIDAHVHVFPDELAHGGYTAGVVGFVDEVFVFFLFLHKASVQRSK